MAIANTGSGDASKTSGTSHSASITVPSGSDLLVVLAWRARTVVGSTTAPSSATIGGNAMTNIGLSPTGTQDTSWVNMYYYLSPPSGSQTVAVSGGGIASDETGYIWSTYSGVQQSGQPDSSAKVDNTTSAAQAFTTTVVAANSWVILGFTNQGSGSNPVTYTNGTQRVLVAPNVGEGIADSNAAVSAGSYTITVNQTSTQINGIIASFSPSTEGTTKVVPQLLTLGVG